jgi:hypothetical protein
VAALEDKDALEQKLIDFQTDFEEKREATETLLATRKAEFQKLKEVKNEKIDKLREELAQKQGQVDTLTEAACEWEKQSAALNEELAAKTNKLLEYENEAESKVKDLADSKEEFKAEIDNYKSMIGSLTATSAIFQENLEKENQELKRQLEEQQKQSQLFVQDSVEKTRAQTERLNRYNKKVGLTELLLKLKKMSLNFIV